MRDTETLLKLVGELEAHLEEGRLVEAEASIKAAEVRAAEFSLQVIDYELAQARARIDDLTARASAPGARTDVDAPRIRSELSELRAYLGASTQSAM